MGAFPLAVRPGGPQAVLGLLNVEEAQDGVEHNLQHHLKGETATPVCEELPTSRQAVELKAPVESCASAHHGHQHGRHHNVGGTLGAIVRLRRALGPALEAAVGVVDALGAHTCTEGPLLWG